MSGTPGIWKVASRHPDSPRVVVGLVPLMKNTKGKQFWSKHFVQFSDGKWSYVGSDQKCRDLKYWCDLPELPLE